MHIGFSMALFAWLCRHRPDQSQHSIRLPMRCVHPISLKCTDNHVFCMWPDSNNKKTWTYVVIVKHTTYTLYGHIWQNLNDDIFRSKYRSFGLYQDLCDIGYINKIHGYKKTANDELEFLPSQHHAFQTRR
jgi:hypothetical protein